MEFYHIRPMISRQGQAITNMYPSAFSHNVRRAKVKAIDPVNSANFSEMLNDLEAERLKEEEEKKNRPVELTSSFKAISREQYAFSVRNKTGSPRVGLYDPIWTAVRPRTTQGPKLKKKATHGKDPNIFTPTCIQDDLQCTRTFSKTGKKNIEVGSFDKTLKRTITNFKEYSEKLEENKVKTHCDPQKVRKHIKSPIKFKKQLKRRDFVSAKDPPHEKRFEFTGITSQVYSRNRRVNSFSFSKSQPRKELFEPKNSLPGYDRNEEFTKERLNLSVLEFEKMTDRKELVLTHMLDNPNPVDLQVYEEAYFKQSTIRGLHKIPMMSTVVPRDDLMYRVTDTYIFNVPEIQSAESKLKFQGDQSLSVLKEKFRANSQ